MPPLVPVTVVVTGFDSRRVHVRFVVAEEPSVRLVCARLQLRPRAEGTFKVTVPVKPLTGVRAIVDVPGEPLLTVTLVGLAPTVKSPTWNDTMAVCDNDPSVPLTVTLLVVADENVQVNVAEPDVAVLVRVTLTWLSEHDGPPFWESATVPVNPLTAEMVIVEVPGELTFTITGLGAAVAVKS